MATFLFLITLISIMHGTCTQACWTGWLESTGHDSCYLIKNTEESWPDAAAFCQALGSRLAIIESADEDAFLRYSIQHLSKTTSYWIDGTDISSEGTWVWASNHLPIQDYNNWAPKQPDDHHGQDCIQMYKAENFDWDDEDCNTKIGFICELVNDVNAEGVIG